MSTPHIYPFTIYYEDTDMTGLVYHPNYFKYFERARSEYFGPERLQRMQAEEGISVAVYRAEIVFKKGAVLGDRLEVHSQPRMDGEYRVVFQQQVRRASDQALYVEATVELVCVVEGKLIKMPRWIATESQTREHG